MGDPSCEQDKNGRLLVNSVFIIEAKQELISRLSEVLSKKASTWQPTNMWGYVEIDFQVFVSKQKHATAPRVPKISHYTPGIHNETCYIVLHSRTIDYICNDNRLSFTSKDMKQEIQASRSKELQIELSETHKANLGDIESWCDKIEEQLIPKLSGEKDRISKKNQDARIQLLEDTIQAIKAAKEATKAAFIEANKDSSITQVQFNNIKTAYKENIQNIIKNNLINNNTLTSHRHWAKKLGRSLLNVVMCITGAALIKWGITGRATFRVSNTKTKDIAEDAYKLVKKTKLI